MLANIGKTIYLDANPNKFDWDLRRYSGQAFEKIINQFIKKHLRPAQEFCKVFETEATGDRGKDTIISFTQPISLFGIEFPVPRGKETGRLHVEIKKKNKGALSSNDFGGSLMQLETDSEPPDFFLLVTTSHLTPNTVFHAQKEFKRIGSQLSIVDRSRLATCLLEAEHEVAKKIDNHDEYHGVNISYCVQHEETLDKLWSVAPQDFHSRKKIYVYLRFQNYDSEEHTLNLDLQSDLNWNLSNLDVNDGKAIKIFLPAYETKSKKIQLSQINFDAIDELRMSISVDEISRSLVIRNKNIKFDFDPPLFGEQHIRTRDQLTTLFRSNDLPDIVEIHGRAGTGKSKLLEEVQRLCMGTTLTFIRRELRPNYELQILSSILKEIQQKEIIGKVPENISSVSDFSSELLSISNHVSLDYVLVFEDLHHSSKELLKWFKSIVGGNQERLKNIAFVVAGRDDNTFFNDHYFSFIDGVSESTQENPESNRIVQIELRAWSDQDCLAFIRSTVVRAPELVQISIKRVSENTPFGAIQSIQYLLDMSILRVVNRNTVGVLNAETFSSKDYLPNGLIGLLDQRLKNLEHIFGPEICCCLSALSYLSIAVPYEIVLEIFDGYDSETIEYLIEKRFLKVEEQRISFFHENIQTYFLEKIENDDVRKEVFKRLATQDQVYSSLHRFQKGYLHYLATNYERAFGYFEEVWVALSDAKNISSVDLPESYFSSISHLIQTAISLKKNASLIQKICVLEVYLALHNRPLPEALRVSERNLITIQELCGLEQNEESYVAQVQQLKAHILLNMGFVVHSQKIMLELLTQARLDKRIESDHNLIFDTYDRLQNVYHQLNHLSQFRQYSDLSLQVAKATGDTKKSSLVTSSRAKEYLFNEPHKFHEETIKATEVALSSASKRHICHARLNRCISGMIVNHRDKSKVKGVISLAQALLNESINESYSFSITRSQILLSTAYCLLGLNDKNNLNLANRYADAGIESALRYGTGFFHWQLHNIKALIEMNQTDSKLEFVSKHFETALYYLDKQGLLFLGELDSLSPNLSVISNIVRFYDENYSDRDTYDLVGRLSYYSKGMLSKDREIRKLIDQTRKYKLVGRTLPLPLEFTEPSTQYFLALR